MEDIDFTIYPIKIKHGDASVEISEDGTVNVIGKVDTSKLLTTHYPSPFTGRPHISKEEGI